jgi:hypothetical protein
MLLHYRYNTGKESEVYEDTQLYRHRTIYGNYTQDLN